MKIPHCYTLSLALSLAFLLPFNAQARQKTDVDDLDIQLVHEHGQPFREYPIHQRGPSNVYRAYLEASPGERYAIRVRNRSGHRIGLVIAADGRNIISGAGSDLKPDERMYILAPHQEATYNGWRTGKNRINNFYFTDAEDSYAGAWDDYSAMGVIAVAAYREVVYSESREQPVYPEGRSRKEGVSPNSKSAPGARSTPGTGFGEEEWSPSRQVRFQPESTPFARYFLKYEWREALCRKGIVNCRQPHEAQNRFWNEGDSYNHYAPFPPGYRDR